MLPYEGYEIYPDNESDTDRIKISGADEDLNHVSNLDAQHPIQINGRPFLNLEFSKIWPWLINGRPRCDHFLILVWLTVVNSGWIIDD